MCFSTRSQDATDDALAEALLDGSPDALGALVCRYGARFYPLALRFAPDAAAARALVVAVFETMMRELPLLGPQVAFIPWLWRLAADELLRSERAAPPVTTPFDRGLWSLEPRDRIALLLREGGELERSAIAWILEEPVAAVAERLHRARLQLCPLVATLEAPRLERLQPQSSPEIPRSSHAP